VVGWRGGWRGGKSTRTHASAQNGGHTRTHAHARAYAPFVRLNGVGCAPPPPPSAPGRRKAVLMTGSPSAVRPYRNTKRWWEPSRWHTRPLSVVQGREHQAHLNVRRSSRWNFVPGGGGIRFGVLLFVISSMSRFIRIESVACHASTRGCASVNVCESNGEQTCVWAPP
jgi:hypothetical protein